MRYRANRVIKEHNQELGFINEYSIKIGYVVSEECKGNKDRLTCGDCRIVPNSFRAFIDYDFIITFYINNIDYMTDEQLDILMLHELMHVGIENGKTKIIKHDTEDFRMILEQYGIDWSDN